MVNVDHSWQFLEELWNEDVRILINETLEISSKIQLPVDVNPKDAIKTLSLLFYGDNSNSISYDSFIVDLLIAEKVLSKNNNEVQSLDKNEERYIIYIWREILSRLSPKKQQKLVNDKNDYSIRLYEIIKMMGVYRPWFTIKEEKLSSINIVSNDRCLPEIKKWLNGRFGERHFLDGILTKLHPQKINARRLMPLAVLLILLRKEYQIENIDGYLKMRLEKSDKESYKKIICGLYKHIDKPEDDIIQEIQNGGVVDFHPKVAKKLCQDNKAFDILYQWYSETLILPEYRKELSNSESILQNLNCNILKTDYTFPYSKVRNNVYFVKKEGEDSVLIDKIYLSISLKDCDYHEHYLSKDSLTSKILFDVIVVREEKDTIRWQHYLSPNGKYVRIKENEIEHQLYTQYKKEFMELEEQRITEGETFLMNILKLDSSNINTETNWYSQCRPKIEEILEKLKEKEIIPKGIKLSGFATFLSGDNQQYELLVEDLMSKPLIFALDFFLKITNDEMHIKNDLMLDVKKDVIERKDINLLRSLAFIICDILSWSKSITEKYAFNESIWKERDPIEGIIEEDRNHKYHVNDCEIRSKDKKRLSVNRSIVVRKYCMHVDYKKTGKGYKYYADIDNQ